MEIGAIASPRCESSHSDPDSEILASLEPVIQRIRRGRSVKYAEDDVFRWRIADAAVRGRPESDEYTGDGMPYFVINGQSLSWE